MPEEQRSGANRRAFLKTTGALGAAGLAGCLGDLTGGGGDDNEVRFLLNPAEGDVDMQEQYAPFFDYIESETDATIDAQETESYTATVDSIRNDHAEMADISPTGVIAAPDHMDVLGIRVAFGAERYFSLITTLPDNDIEELTDLEGREVALVDPLSVSGGLFPLYMLQEAGLDVGTAPDGDPVDFTVNYSDHSQARETLINREDVHAAGTGAFSTAAHVPEDQFSDDFLDISAEAGGVGSEEPELQLLAESDPIPRAPLVARSSWDNEELKEDIEEALLNATEEDLSHDEDYEGEELWFTGVKPGSIDDYQPIQDVMDALDLEFGDIAD